MLDTILSQLNETRDRQAAMILLQGLDAPMAVLTIRTEVLTGELWIANGKHLCYAKVLPNGDGGLMDMLRLLAIKEGDFSLVVCDGKEPPALPLQVALAEIVADEHAVARRIKNVLWPVSDVEPDSETQSYAKTALAKAETEIATEKAAHNVADESATKKKKKSKKKTLAELEETKVRVAASDKPPESVKAIENESIISNKEPEPEPKPEPEPELEPAKTAESIIDDRELVAPSVSTSASSIDQHKLLESLLDEQPPIGKAPEDAESKPAWDGISQHLVASESFEKPSDVAALSDSNITKEDEAGDKLDHKRRAEYQALNTLLGEEASKFYDEEEAYAQMSEDELKEQRREEIDALSKMLTESTDEFKAKPTPVNVDRESDEVMSKRQADYEALKLFYAEEPEKFQEVVGLSESLGDPGLTDFQRRILELAGQEESDQPDFQEGHHELLTETSLRPSWEPPSEKVVDEPIPEPTIKDEEFVAGDVASPYDEAASSLGRYQKLRAKLALGGESQSLELVDRMGNIALRDIATAPEASFRRKVISNKYIYAAAACILVIPLVAFTIWHHFDAESQENLAMQRESALLASRSIEKTSVVEKPQEAFRMPAAGPVNASPPANTGSGSSSNSGAAPTSGISDAERDAHYDWHPPSNQQSISADQMAMVNVDVAKADAFLGSGYGDRAASLYVPLLQKYPTYTLLRIKAARAYMSMKQYRQAYSILISGLDSCPTRSDFDMVVNVIKEIP
jgi:hypothetical protein